MLLSITLIAALLIATYLVVFPKTKGTLKPIKIPVEQNKR
jgi:hypothetical protein